MSTQGQGTMARAARALTLTLVACACEAPAPEGDDADDADPPQCLAPADDGRLGDAPTTRAAIAAVVEDAPIAGVAVGVARGADLVWLDAFGDARPNDGVAATVDTPFAIASVTKVLVATAAMILEEEGLLALDEDVGAQAPALAAVRNPHFPDVAITPRMLLTHTSTLWDVPFTYDDTWVTHGDATRSMHDFVVGYFDPASDTYGGADMWWTDAPPGEFSCYSNMGIAVLGVLLEERSGQSLEELLRARIFDPLGMHATSFRIDAYCDADALARGSRPLGSTRADGFADDNLGGPSSPGQPEGHPELASGMLKTSARDLLRFAVTLAEGGALEDARILSDANVARMLARQLDAGLLQCGDGRSDPAHQALGFTHFPDPAGVDWTGHYGGMAGATASLWLDPAPGGLRYVVLMNQLDMAAMSAVEVALLQDPPP